MSQTALNPISGYYKRIVIDIKLHVPQEQKMQAKISMSHCGQKSNKEFLKKISNIFKYPKHISQEGRPTLSQVKIPNKHV